MILKRTWAFLNYVIGEYGRDNCNQLAAAVSYYVLFSIVPFTIFTVSIFGVVLGRDELQRDFTPAVVDFVGIRQGAPVVDIDEAQVSAQSGAQATAEQKAPAAALPPVEANHPPHNLPAKP